MFQVHCMVRLERTSIVSRYIRRVDSLLHQRLSVNRLTDETLTKMVKKLALAQVICKFYQNLYVTI
jgi:hypothetical protein